MVEVLARLVLGGRKPCTIAMDNGPEFTSKQLAQWAYLHVVELDFSQPGKATDNARIRKNVSMKGDCFRECSNWRRVEKGRATLRIGSDKDQFEVSLPCSL